MNCAGMGKTTLANEICFQWAKEGGLLADEFDAVINIPLKFMQVEGSFETMLKQHVGEECYPEVKKLAGRGFLLIVEGLDEVPPDFQQKDRTWNRLINQNILLEEARILITSRPHACEKLVIDRTVEVVGFGNKEIRQFVEHSFPNDAEEFMEQLTPTKHPHLCSLCQVPVHLVMLIDIYFTFNQKKKCPSTQTELQEFSQNKELPSTLTKLYQLFIEMILLRDSKVGRSVKKSTDGDHVGHSVMKLTFGDHAKATLKKHLPDIEDALEIVYKLSHLAYRAYFDKERKANYNREGRIVVTERQLWADAKSIFTELDLTKSGIEVTNRFDGFALLKLVHTPTNTIMYDFLHLTVHCVQEFLCSLYMSTLSEQEQLNLPSDHFIDYPNVMMFLCGLTGLATNEMFKFVYSGLTFKLTGLASNEMFKFSLVKFLYLTLWPRRRAVTAVRCVYESKCRLSIVDNPPAFTLDMSHSTLLPYDRLYLSWLLSCYPVSQLKMNSCCIGDTGVKLLVSHYPNNNSTGQLLEVLDLCFNDFTIAGLEDVMKIVRTSKPQY